MYICCVNPTTIGAHRGAYAQGCYHLVPHRDRETRDRSDEEEPARTNLNQKIDDPPTLAGLDPTRVHCNLSFINIGVKIIIKFMEKTRKQFECMPRNRLQHCPSCAACMIGRTYVLNNLQKKFRLSDESPEKNPT